MTRRTLFAAIGSIIGLKAKPAPQVVLPDYIIRLERVNAALARREEALRLVAAYGGSYPKRIWLANPKVAALMDKWSIEQRTDRLAKIRALNPRLPQ